MPPSNIRPCDVKSRDQFQAILSRDEANIEEMKTSSDRLHRAVERTHDLTRKSKEIQRSMSRGRSLPRPQIERDLVRQGKVAADSPARSEATTNGESPRTGPLCLQDTGDIYEHTKTLVSRVDKVDGIMNKSLSLIEDLNRSEKHIDPGSLGRPTVLKSRVGNPNASTPTSSAARAQAEAALVTRLAVPKRKCVTPTQGAKRTRDLASVMERSKSSGNARVVSISSRSDSPTPPNSASSASAFSSSTSSMTFNAPKAFARTHTASKETPVSGVGHQKRTIRPPSGPPKRATSGGAGRSSKQQADNDDTPQKGATTPKTAMRQLVPSGVKSPKTSTPVSSVKKSLIVPSRRANSGSQQVSASQRSQSAIAAPTQHATTPTSGSKTPKSTKNVTIVEPDPLSSVKLIPVPHSRVTSDSPILPPSEYGALQSAPQAHSSQTESSPTPAQLATMRDRSHLNRILDGINRNGRAGGQLLLSQLRDLERFMSDDGSETSLEMCLTHYEQIMRTLLTVYEAPDCSEDVRNRSTDLVFLIHNLTVPEEMMRLVASLFTRDTGLFEHSSPNAKNLLLRLLAEVLDAATQAGSGSGCHRITPAVFDPISPVLAACVNSSEVALRKRAVYVFVAMYSHLRADSLPHLIGLTDAQLKLCQHYIGKQPGCEEADLVFEVAEYHSMR